MVQWGRRGGGPFGASSQSTQLLRQTGPARTGAPSIDPAVEHSVEVTVGHLGGDLSLDTLLVDGQRDCAGGLSAQRFVLGLRDQAVEGALKHFGALDGAGGVGGHGSVFGGGGVCVEHIMHRGQEALGSA